mmetsp:Transcript_29741/g.79117  ORF Transcript_29741/g.79117 Transcript_29741/m.79117 type:complete len:227 (+) Transcript_29741:61-741(+)
MVASRIMLLLLASQAGANFLIPLVPQRAPERKSSVDHKSSKRQPVSSGKLASRMVVAAPVAPVFARVLRRIVRLPRRIIAMVPGRLPKWWLASGLTPNSWGRAAFLGSNVAYLAAGVRLLARAAPNPLGWLMLSCCGVSTAYHSMQCMHGCDSEEAAKWCWIDTTVAVSSGLCFMQAAGPRCLTSLPLLAGALSAAFFLDVFRLGYTTTHSFWHLSSALAAVLVVR